MDPKYRLSDYDRRRQEELRRANPALFWITFFLIAGAVMVYFMMQPGW